MYEIYIPHKTMCPAFTSLPVFCAVPIHVVPRAEMERLTSHNGSSNANTVRGDGTDWGELRTYKL